MGLSTFNIEKLNVKHFRLRLGEWNVQGLNFACKQVENSQILYKNHIDNIGCAGELGGDR